MTNVVGFPVTHNIMQDEQKGWSYLLAESVAFKKEVGYGIRIQKPDQEIVPKWISKLITSGKCNSIYVENLHLKASDKATIEGLCHKHNVSLFSLSVVQESQRRVIQGPW